MINQERRPAGGAEVGVLVGTTNRFKAQRWRRILTGLVPVVFPEDLGLTVLVPETDHSTTANAARKAAMWSRASGLPTIADDLGLFIDALGGFPGAAMKTWGGKITEQATEPRRLALLRAEVSGLSSTQCRLETAIAAATPAGRTARAVHREHGWIDQARLHRRHTYGPLLEHVFVPARFGKPWTEMNEHERDLMDEGLRRLATRLVRNHLQMI